MLARNNSTTRVDRGPVGKDGAVTVVDTAPIMVLSVGLKGVYRMKRINEGLMILNEWIVEHPAWRAAGDPRALFIERPSDSKR